MNWIDYVKSVAGNDKNAAIGYKSGVTEATVSRWGKSAPKPENVAAFARSYHRPVLEAFVAAGYLTPEEANEQPTARPSLTELSSDELIQEIARRLKAGEQGERDTSPMNQAGVRPADDWPHFDPDERTETEAHLRAREQLARSDYGLIADRGPSEGKRQADEADRRGEESQDA